MHRTGVRQESGSILSRRALSRSSRLLFPFATCVDFASLPIAESIFESFSRSETALP
jgi:hypothetical protein